MGVLFGSQSTTPALRRRVPKPGSPGGRDRNRAGYWFVLPCVVFTVVFFLVPLVMTLGMSLYNWPLMGVARFAGFRNYLDLLQDASFWAALWFTTEYTLFVTPAIFVVAFVLAMLVNRARRFVGLFRTAFFLPVVIGLTTASLLWVWMYNDQVGIFSAMLMQLGIIDEPVQWFGDTNSALWSLIVMILWKASGFTMVILLVGMQAIPQDLYDAARIDGARWWAQQRYITVPLMRRTFALALIMAVIGSYLAFEQFYVMTRGGPMNTTITVVHWIYRASFTYFKLGYGAAMSVVLLIVLLLLSVIQMILLRDDHE
ncbi:carbohydrate ABC transporter permease [Pararobbsia alpina]|uniref:Lactose transport system permease protein LacF n=1 Tax=Pararobbsia alpina TaxID=621374 RepID=A0A6S7B975_9BURK|nr:sugar ABC transporter permease [Pararobbsia alpina]CAB3792389.1 Lactose transport system permease protein LacF [Pararobbsia alpina]